jgi:hypothetical protein
MRRTCLSPPPDTLRWGRGYRAPWMKVPQTLSRTSCSAAPCPFIFHIYLNTPPPPVFSPPPPRRSMWLPGSSVENAPDLIQNELFSSPASSEGWISLNGKMLATHPGQYILTVSAFSGGWTAGGGGRSVGCGDAPSVLQQTWSVVCPLLLLLLPPPPLLHTQAPRPCHCVCGHPPQCCSWQPLRRLHWARWPLSAAWGQPTTPTASSVTSCELSGCWCCV